MFMSATASPSSCRGLHTDRLRQHIGHNWGRASAAGGRTSSPSTTPSLGWAEEEGFIAENPSRMKRPPRRGANVYRPPTADVELGYRATTLHEREAWLLMGGLGLGAETVCKARWSDLDLRRGRISVKVKGGVTSVTGSDKRSPGGNHHPAQSP